MTRIQLVAISVSVLFLLYVMRLVTKSKLRVEYSIIWIATTVIFFVFSLWKDGLEYIADFLQVYEAPNLIFTGAIFAIMVYLIHLSVVVSKLHDKNRSLIQELGILKAKNKKDEDSSSNKI